MAVLSHCFAGFASFLPLAAQVQFGGAAVARGRVVLYRLPWAELFRLRYKFPQWSVLMRSMVDSLHAAGVHGSFDMVAHSYGTVVTNRFLRHLGEIHARAAQKDGAVAEAPVVREDEQKEPTVRPGPCVLVCATLVHFLPTATGRRLLLPPR